VSKALVVAPPGVSPTTLGNIFTAFPALVPQVIIDGLGAVVEVPDALVGPLAQSGVNAVATGAIANIQSLPVAPVLWPWLEAWNKLFDPAYQHMLATRAAQWLTSTAMCDRAVSGFPPPAQTMTLTGDVAVGILTIDGPGSAKLSLTDIADLTLSVLHGFDILYRNAPAAAKLVFMAEPRTVTLGVDPATVPPPLADPTNASFSEFELREAKWRDPALAALGLPAGFDGINKYRTNLVECAWPAGNPQKSIVMLLTNYNAVRFGYAANGRFVMQLSAARSGVTVTHLDRVIAHETCHLFNAPDEYGSCVPLQTFDPFSAPNGNCVNSIIPHTPCLMAGETDDICAWSKAHVGWNPLPFFPIPPVL
jgi:hypothetical protein